MCKSMSVFARFEYVGFLSLILESLGCCMPIFFCPYSFISNGQDHHAHCHNFQIDLSNHKVLQNSMAAFVVSTATKANTYSTHWDARSQWPSFCSACDLCPACTSSTLLRLIKIQKWYCRPSKRCVKLWLGTGRRRVNDFSEALWTESLILDKGSKKPTASSIVLMLWTNTIRASHKQKLFQPPKCILQVRLSSPPWPLSTKSYSHQGRDTRRICRRQNHPHVGRL